MLLSVCLDILSPLDGLQNHLHGISNWVTQKWYMNEVLGIKQLLLFLHVEHLLGLLEHFLPNKLEYDTPVLSLSFLYAQ